MLKLIFRIVSIAIFGLVLMGIRAIENFEFATLMGIATIIAYQLFPEKPDKE